MTAAANSMGEGGVMKQRAEECQAAWDEWLENSEAMVSERFLNAIRELIKAALSTPSVVSEGRPVDAGVAEGVDRASDPEWVRLGSAYATALILNGDMRRVLREMDEYLKPNHRSSIFSGSNFHKEIQYVLAQAETLPPPSLLSKGGAGTEQALTLKQLGYIPSFWALRTLDPDDNYSNKAIKNIGIAQKIYREIKALYKRPLPPTLPAEVKRGD